MKDVFIILHGSKSGGRYMIRPANIVAVHERGTQKFASDREEDAITDDYTTVLANGIKYCVIEDFDAIYKAMGLKEKTSEPA